MRKLLRFGAIAMLAFALTGCEGESEEGSKIKVVSFGNKAKMEFVDVKYYDFEYMRNIPRVKWKNLDVLSNVNDTDVIFEDPNHNIREMHIDKAINSGSKKIKVYLDALEITSETYTLK